MVLLKRLFNKENMYIKEYLIIINQGENYMCKVEKDIHINELEKKDIFSIKNICLFFGQLVSLIVIVSCFILYVKIPVGNLGSLSPISILSVQTSISLLSITIMQLILPDRKERIFGATYQSILFKWKVLKYFNALDCMMYMLILMMTNISLAVMSVIVTNSNAKLICILSFLCIMIESFILMVYMIHLGLIARFKKSRIYYWLYKRISKRNIQSTEVYNMLLKGMKESNEKNQNNEKSDYLDVEVCILKYMLSHIEEFKLYNMNKEEAFQLIKIELDNRISVKK